MSTIKDVAAAAGVSVSTVSNIINNKSSVNIDLYNRVMQVMKELHYRPNILAKNLRKNQTNFIGVIFGEPGGYTSRVLEEVVNCIWKSEYQPIVRIVYEDDIEMKEALKCLIGTGVKGIVICSPFLDTTILEEIDKCSVPILLLDYCVHLPGVLTMEFDNTTIVEGIVQKLLESKKSVGLITGTRAFATEESCWLGFERAFQKEKGSFEKSWQLEMPFQRHRLFEKLLDQFPVQGPLCWIVSNECFVPYIQEIMSIRGTVESELYVLSYDQDIRKNAENVHFLHRKTKRCVSDAMDMLLAQIQDPMMGDSPNRVMHTSNRGIRRDPLQAEIKKYGIGKPLRVLLPDAPMKNSIIKLSSDFTNRTGVQVEFVCKNMTELLHEIVEGSTKPEKSYDVVTFHINWMSYLGKQGILRSLEKHMDLHEIWKEYLPNVRNVFLKRDYAFYGLPAEIGIQILAYRDDLFSDPAVQRNYYSTVGMELRPPRSWTEFNIIAHYFTRAFNATSPSTYGTCIAGHVPTGLIEEFWPRSRAFCGKAIEGQPMKLTSLGNVRALQHLCDSYHYSYPDCRTFMDSEQVNQMLTDDIAMIVTYNNYMLLNRGNRGKRIRFAPTPSNMTVMDSYLLGIPSSSQDVNAAAQFIQWCCSNESAQRSLLLGRVLPKQNVACSRELESAGMDGTFDCLEEVVFKEEMFGMHLGNSEYENIFAQGLADAVYGGQDPKLVMEELEKKISGYKK